MHQNDKLPMDEHHLQNKTLSLKAKGLFSLMLDKMKEVPDWNFTIRKRAKKKKGRFRAGGNSRP